MTAFTRTWNAAYEASPPDSQAASQGANRIRELKNDIAERLEVDHSWAGDTHDGAHNKVSLKLQAGDPTEPATGSYGMLYTKNDGDSDELYFKDDLGNVIQLTNGGQLLLNGQLGSYYLARGNHTGTQVMATISDAGALATLNQADTAQLVDGAVTTAKLDTGAVTSAKIGNDAVGSAELTTTLTSGSSQSIDAGNTWAIPAGLHTMTWEGPGLGRLEILIAAVWYGVSAFTGGAVLSDGTNVRIRETTGTDSITVYYRTISTGT